MKRWIILAAVVLFVGGCQTVSDTKVSDGKSHKNEPSSEPTRIPNGEDSPFSW
jgi:hypothetical protein